MATATRVSEAYSKTKAVLSGKIEETQVKKATRKRNQEAVSQASKLTPDSVAESLKTIKLQVTETFDNIQNTLLTKFGNVKEIEEAIEAKQEQLKELHDLHSEADALAILLETKKLEQERARVEQQGIRSSWLAEKAQHEKEDKAFREELVTSRRREEESYRYDTKKRRQADEDVWRQERKEEVEAFNAEVSTRTAELAAEAKVFADGEVRVKELEAKVVEVETQAEKRTAKEVAIATNALKSNLTHAFELERKDFQNKVEKLETELASKQVRVAELEHRNEELNQKYMASILQVQQIAERAIDGASKQAVVVQTPNHDVSEGRKR